MKSPVISVHPDDPVERAALLMEEHKISGLPVADADELKGIITITDMLRAFVAMLGLREGGTRVTVTLPDAPGVLAQVASAAAPSNIIAAVTAGVQAGSPPRTRRAGGGRGCVGVSLSGSKRRGLEVIDVRDDAPQGSAGGGQR